MKKVKIFFIDLFGWFKSILIMAGNTKKLRIFHGFKHFEFAKKYATKRHDNWKDNWDQLGKQQGVIPYDETKLIVCSPLEIKLLVKSGYIDGKHSYKKYFKSNYFKTNKR